MASTRNRLALVVIALLFAALALFTIQQHRALRVANALLARTQRGRSTSASPRR